MSLVSQTWAINACLCCLPVDPKNARRLLADICDLSCCSQCSAITWLPLITWQVMPNIPAKLYYAAHSGRPSHMILITVPKLALTFTMHAVGNGLILFHHYCSTTIVLSPSSRDYRRNLFIYRGNTTVTVVLPFFPLLCHSLIGWDRLFSLRSTAADIVVCLG